MKLGTLFQMRRQRRARKRYEREKQLRERQRAGGGPKEVAEKVKSSGAGSGFPTGGGF
jgi:hypothetical protein